ncbi:hypothetical protein A0H81_14617 [Grifola frondosa]|uniref:Uncharacterized protein n=1 Tax=Grifola frondosa TaxID=5627 RepID=A0A1C7LMT1_GRIFR|nr:hypothetical protein A0H81_14617 [Grifola frondosa]
MIASLPSSKFAAIYDSLPADAQQALVEKHLIPLLNHVDKTRYKKVIGTAVRLKKRHAGLPSLDLKAKKIEIDALLDELHKDAKRSFVKERSHKHELLNETVESLTNWLSDIWSVVYEYNVDFIQAHRCLVFIVTTLDHISSARSGCRCSFTQMYIPVTLKRKSGKRIKSFDITGAHNLEEVLFFMWRDLFLSLLAFGTEKQKSKIPEMLEEIEDLMGWTALERVLYGGRKCPHDLDDEDDDDIEDDEDDEDAYTDEEDVEDDESFIQTWQLRKYIQSTMTAIFKLTPSLRLYSALVATSTDPESTEEELMEYLEDIAKSCPETFAAALEIYALEDDTEEIMSLLDSHSHLLRPRDAPALQAAVSIIATNPFYQSRALQIIEKEMLDTARAVRAAIQVSFSQLNTPANTEELHQIMKLRAGTTGRQDRVERWVDAISTPGTNAPNPMVFAAMMMGLPLVPGMDAAEDADPLGYLDLDPDDPDLEDLREEFRPRMKQRFEGWADTAITTKGGVGILLKVYKEVIEMMPFLKANDIVEELVGRLADKPSKHHVCDGVDALSAFAKVQRRKVNMAKSEVKRRNNLFKPQPTASGSSSSGAPATSWSVTACRAKCSLPLLFLLQLCSLLEQSPWAREWRNGGCRLKPVILCMVIFTQFFYHLQRPILYVNITESIHSSSSTLKTKTPGFLIRSPTARFICFPVMQTRFHKGHRSLHKPALTSFVDSG